MNKQTALLKAEALQPVLDENGLYAKIQNIHGEYQIVLCEVTVPRNSKQLELFPNTNSRVGKTSVPYWVTMGLDGPLTLTNH